MVEQANRYYVYKLTDPSTGWPFYIGKGTGGRTWQHLRADRDVVNLLLHDDAEQATSELAALASPAASSDAGTDLRAQLSGVRQRVLEIRAAGAEPSVEWLIGRDGEGMSEATALVVEAALIDVLRSLPTAAQQQIVNKVSGHRYRFGAHSSLSAASDAQPVQLPDDRNFILVPSKGVWGGKDSTGQFAGASREVAWENARDAWPMAVRPFVFVNEHAGTESPVILIGLASDPLKRFSNIIVCVEELSSVSVITEDDPTRGQHAGGKRFARPSAELASTTELRAALLGNAPFAGNRSLSPNMALVYHGPWRNAVVG